MFFVDGIRWSADSKGARDFVHTFKAIQYARSLRQPELEIVLTFDEEDYNIRLPMLPLHRELEQGMLEVEPVVAA